MYDDGTKNAFLNFDKKKNMASIHNSLIYLSVFFFKKKMVLEFLLRNKFVYFYLQNELSKIEL